MSYSRILIKAPVSKSRIFECFSLIHLLKRIYPDSELNIIVDEDISELYSFLEENVSIFKLPPSDRSLIRAHHYAVNLHEVFNQDLYLDLEGSLFSSFLGINFRVPTRIGPEKKFSKFFYTKYFNDDESLYEIISLISGKTYSSEKISAPVLRDDIAQELHEVDSNFILMIVTDINFLTGSLVKEFFNIIQKQRFKIIFMSSSRNELENDLKEELNIVNNSFSHSNLYQYGFEVGDTELIKLILSSKGVVSNSSYFSNLACYHQVSSVFIGEEKIFSPYLKKSPINFLENHKIIIKEDNIFNDLEKLVDFLVGEWNLEGYEAKVFKKDLCS